MESSRLPSLNASLVFGSSRSSENFSDIKCISDNLVTNHYGYGRYFSILFNAHCGTTIHWLDHGVINIFFEFDLSLDLFRVDSF